jgi:hypothetical protein
MADWLYASATQPTMDRRAQHPCKGAHIHARRRVCVACDVSRVTPPRGRSMLWWPPRRSSGSSALLHRLLRALPGESRLGRLRRSDKDCAADVRCLLSVPPWMIPWCLSRAPQVTEQRKQQQQQGRKRAREEPASGQEARPEARRQEGEGGAAERSGGAGPSSGEQAGLPEGAKGVGLGGVAAVAGAAGEGEK